MNEDLKARSRKEQDLDEVSRKAFGSMIELTSYLHGIPELSSWNTHKNRSKHSCGIEGQVEPYQEVANPVRFAFVERGEDVQKLKEDREFDEEHHRSVVN